MHVGITGYPGSGKTTVFNCLTGAEASTGYGSKDPRQPNRAVIKVPDSRVDRLSAIFRPKKTTYADIAFVDVPGPAESTGAKDSLDPHSVAELRRLDALVHVIHAFGESDGSSPRPGSDPKRDLIDFDQELVLSDLMVIEKRIERLRKEGGQGRELDTLEKVRGHLEDGERAARSLDLDPPSLALLVGFQLLSLKAQLALLNVGDATSAPAIEQLEHDLVPVARNRGIELLTLRARLEGEIGSLSNEDQAAFLADLGLRDSARARFVQSSYAMLDLICFFTVGEDEVRAWTIGKGTTAVRAAGKIHSDLERGFIRAEVVGYEDFAPLGKMSRARETGKLRLEGKDYVVEDGDIVNVRFNV